MDTPHARALIALVLLFAAASAVFASGDFESAGWIVGSGRIQTEDRVVPDFNAIEVDGSGNVTIHSGAPGPVTVETDDNVLPAVMAEVRGNVLHLGIKRGVHVSRMTRLEFTVSSPIVRGIAISGSGNARTASTIKGDSLSLTIGGSGNITCDADVTSLRADIGGSGTIAVSGSADRLGVTISGSGSVRAKECQSAVADVQINGSGDAAVKASSTVDISINGSGSVLYGGGAKATLHVSGSGKAREY